MDFPKAAGWVSSPWHCCREPGTVAQNFFQSTQVICGRAGKKPGYLHSAARTLLTIRRSESTSLLHIINKPLNPSSEGGSRIALYKSGVVSSEIVYQLASNPGFSCCLFKNSQPCFSAMNFQKIGKTPHGMSKIFISAVFAANPWKDWMSDCTMTVFWFYHIPSRKLFSSKVNNRRKKFAVKIFIFCHESLVLKCWKNTLCFHCF